MLLVKLKYNGSLVQDSFKTQKCGVPLFQIVRVFLDHGIALFEAI